MKAIQSTRACAREFWNLTANLWKVAAYFGSAVATGWLWALYGC